MIETDRLRHLSQRVLTGEPWHADSVHTLLADVTAAEAAARVVSGAHTIWELVLHVTGWANEACARLNGAEAGTPVVGDWPGVDQVDDAAWADAKTELFAAYGLLEQRLSTLGEGDLDRPVLDRRSGPSGEGASRYVTANGALHHAIYHAGQIALLKSVLRKSK